MAIDRGDVIARPAKPGGSRLVVLGSSLAHLWLDCRPSSTTGTPING